jgi:hypothetical protein
MSSVESPLTVKKLKTKFYLTVVYHGMPSMN